MPTESEPTRLSTRESRQLTQEKKRDWRDYRSRKRKQFRGREKQEIDLVNIFKSIGVDYLIDEKRAYQKLAKVLEGKRVDSIPEVALEFIKLNYDTEQVVDYEDRVLLHFKKRKVDDNMASYIKEIAEEIGEHASTVSKVMDGLLKIAKRHLRHDRKFLIPSFVRIVVRYQAAKPKRQVRNPFKGGKLQWAEAKDATNRLKVFPTKQLKDYAAEKVAVVEPEKKTKKKKG